MLGLGVILVVFLGEETYYNPKTANRQATDAGNGKSEWLSRWEKLVGIASYRAHYKGVGSTIKTMGIMVCRPHFLALCGMYPRLYPLSPALPST
jgi:hypothetical protein